MPDDDQVQQSLASHSHRVDQALAAFLASLGICIELAQHRLSNYLLKTLALEAGVVARTTANIRILRKLSTLWQKSLDDAGLEHVVTGFTDTFPQQIREFEQILRVVNHAAKEPLPIPAFTAADKTYFKALQDSASIDIAATVEAPGAALRTAPGISFKDLSKFIVDKTGAARSRTETIADTSLMGHYRSVSGVGYEKIEAKLGRPLFYGFYNPIDEATSLKCEVAVRQSQATPWTRKYIDTLEPYPGSPAPVWIYGFHYRCRGSFNVSLKQS